MAKVPEKMDGTAAAIQDSTAAAQGRTDEVIPHAPAETVLTTEEDTTALEEGAVKKTLKGDDVPKWLGKHSGARLVQFFPNSPGKLETWALVHNGEVVAEVDMTDTRIVPDEVVVELVVERIYTVGTTVLSEKRFALP